MRIKKPSKYISYTVFALVAIWCAPWIFHRYPQIGEISLWPPSIKLIPKEPISNGMQAKLGAGSKKVLVGNAIEANTDDNSRSSSPANQVISAPNGIVVAGGSVNNATVNNIGQLQRHITDLPSQMVNLLNQYIQKYQGTVIPIWVWHDAESIHLAHELEEYANSKGGKAQIAGWIISPPPSADLRLDPYVPKITIGPHR